jgi:hypothetical protein
MLECRECGVGVHEKCNPLDLDAQFVCYTCKVGLQDQCCAVCECVGGFMLPTELMSDSPILQGRFAP